MMSFLSFLFEIYGPPAYDGRHGREALAHLDHAQTALDNGDLADSHWHMGEYHDLMAQHHKSLGDTEAALEHQSASDVSFKKYYKIIDSM